MGLRWIRTRPWALGLYLIGLVTQASADTWRRTPALRDVRYQGALDVAREIRAGGAVLALPWTIQDGVNAFDSLVVGEGWIALAARQPAGDLRGPVMIVDGQSLRLGERIEVLAGQRVSLDGPVLALTGDDIVAVRWTSLRVSGVGAPAIVEVAIAPSGAAIVQYLHVPEPVRSLTRTRELRAVAGESAASATAFALLEETLPRDPAPPETAQAGPPPTGCDPEQGTWCARAGAGCTDFAGTPGYSACTDTMATQWAFNESTYCAGCTYTFYILVECGREMHLPVEDMEGLQLSITDVLTGSTPELRCVNDAARGNAPQVIRCGNRYGTGPPFDQTSASGSLSWGFPDCVAAGDIACSEVPAGGGTLTRLSPGEMQVMDCWIESAAGLCGIYRVDVISGGFEWRLFSNCDGTNTPQFEIFTDCTAAWAAFEPLPELAVANVTVYGSCPDLEVRFDLQNLGCADHVGGVPVRVQTNCPAGDLVNVVVPDTVPGSGSVSVRVPIQSSCDPVRVDVFVDPDDDIAECTESPTAAACRAIPGVDTLSAFGCGCTAQLVADAGPDQAACSGETVTLDGSASMIAPCAQPQYRWLDASGNELQAPSSDATMPVTVTCPGASYTLEVFCPGESCIDADVVRVDCVTPAASAGADFATCEGQDLVLSAAASSVPGCPQPLYRFLDGAGGQLRGWSNVPTFNLGPMTAALAGTYGVEAACAPGSPCASSDTVVVSLMSLVAEAGGDLAACEAVPFTALGSLASSSGCATFEFRWLDSSGFPLSTFSSDPTFTNAITGCPASLQLVLETRCADPGAPACSSFDVTTVTCGARPTPRPSVTASCAGRSASLSCGLGAGVSASWDLDVASDSDGDGTSDNDADIAGCDVLASWPSAGTRTVRCNAVDGSCSSFADQDVTVADGTPRPVPAAVAGCPNTDSLLDCGASWAASTSWDFDTAVDSDGNTVADDDVNASTCNARRSYPAGTFTARVTAVDASGCSTVADVSFLVVAGARPSDADDLRVTKAGTDMVVEWSPASASSTHRVARGDIGAYYSHRFDDGAGVGSCDSSGTLKIIDSDDLVLPGSFYYLALGVSGCGGSDGGVGSGWDGTAPFARPDPTGTCP